MLVVIVFCSVRVNCDSHLTIRIWINVHRYSSVVNSDGVLDKFVSMECGKYLGVHVCTHVKVDHASIHMCIWLKRCIDLHVYIVRSFVGFGSFAWSWVIIMKVILVGLYQWNSWHLNKSILQLVENIVQSTLKLANSPIFRLVHLYINISTLILLLIGRIEELICSFYDRIYTTRSQHLREAVSI